MKLFLRTLFSIFIFVNSGNAQQYSWVQKASFPGTPREAAVGIAIGN